MARPEDGLTNNEKCLLELESWNHRWTSEDPQEEGDAQATVSEDVSSLDRLANLSIRTSHALMQFDNDEAKLLRDFFGLYQEESFELDDDEFSWAKMDGEHKGPKIYIDNGIGLDIRDKQSLLHRFFLEMNAIDSDRLPLEYPAILAYAAVLRQALGAPSSLEQHDWARMYLTGSKYELIESVLNGMHPRQASFVRKHLGLGAGSSSNRDVVAGMPEFSEDLQGISLRKFLRKVALKLAAPIEKPNIHGE